MVSARLAADHDAGRCLVMDLGSSQIRAGWADAADPSVLVDPWVLRNRDRESGEMVSTVGQYSHRARTPFDTGVVANMELFEPLLDYSLMHLSAPRRISESRLSAVFTEPLCVPPLARAVMSEFLIEGYGFDRVAFGVDSLFSLSANTPSGNLFDGDVLSISHSSTQTIRVEKGWPDFTHASRIPVSCVDLGKFMGTLMQTKYPYFPLMIGESDMKQLFEKNCYMAFDYDTEAQRLLLSPQEDIVVQYPVTQIRSMLPPSERVKLSAEESTRMEASYEKYILDLVRERDELLALRNGGKSSTSVSRRRQATQIKMRQVQNMLNEFSERGRGRRRETRSGTRGSASSTSGRGRSFSGRGRGSRGGADIGSRRGNAAAKELSPVLKIEEESSSSSTSSSSSSSATPLPDIVIEGEQAVGPTTDPVCVDDSAEFVAEAIKPEINSAEQSPAQTQEAAPNESWRAGTPSSVASAGGQPNSSRAEFDDDDEEEAMQRRLVNIEKLLLEHDSLHQFQRRQFPMMSRFTDGIESPSRGEEGLKRAHQIRLSTERIRVPEALISPSIMGVDSRGITEALSGTTKVFCTGGGAKIPGIEMRLARELQLDAQAGVKVFAQTASDPILDAWRGAAAVARQRTKDLVWLTRANFAEEGPIRIFATRHQWSNPA